MNKGARRLHSEQVSSKSDLKKNTIIFYRLFTHSHAVDKKNDASLS